MKSDRRRPRNSNHKSASSEGFFQSAGKNLPATSNEQQFHRLLKHLMTAVSKDSSNNVAIVAMAAIFFGFAVLVLKPAAPVAQPQINLQSNPTITVKTQQEQNQRIDRGSDTGS
ncbi:hypothetical protein [Nostoc sp. C110]|uniref:hypothetical protein n=1 Tax=Nostoc sp. C110 TaxID=3349876 RepID=UPI00370D0EA7